jgi:hypothetical protein
MKSLLIQPSLRRHLISKGALSVDFNGWEVLVGLTRAESITYLSMSHEVASGRTSDNLDELELFLEIVNRHDAALPTSSYDIRACDDHYSDPGHNGWRINGPLG